MAYTYKYPHFALTVDAVIFSKSAAGLNVLLIRRADEPYKDCWTFPGGFVNIEETFDNAVNREMNFPAAEQRSIFGNYFLFAASGGELTPKEIRGTLKM